VNAFRHEVGGGRVIEQNTGFEIRHEGLLIPKITKVKIMVKPDTIDKSIRDAEAAQWEVGFMQTLRSVGRSIRYRNTLCVFKFLSGVPIRDNPSDDSDNLFYRKSFTMDGETVTLDVPRPGFPNHAYVDFPRQSGSWNDPTSTGETNSLMRAITRDQFTFWLAARRKATPGCPETYKHLKNFNWSVDTSVRFDMRQPVGSRAQIRPNTFDTSAGTIRDGRGAFTPKLDGPLANDTNNHTQVYFRFLTRICG